MLRDMQHQIGGLRIERRAGGPVTASTIAMTSDAAFAVDRTTLVHGIGARHDGILQT